MDRIKLLQQFLEEDPSDIFIRYALALEYEKTGDLNNAITQLTNLLYEHPEYLPTYFQLGRMQEVSGNSKAAFETYERGVGLAQKTGNVHIANELRGAIDGLNENFEI